MADVIRKATNKFTKGLVMDFSPENTRNEVLTHALNATFLTFNGNELSLQNDMGNARVETAFLPEGYMPVGTCEYGGIIYIVSYNPLEDKSQIGCFPSPERNISSDELGISDVIISPEAFQVFESGVPTGDILNTSKYVLLRNDNLNPGDKFLVHADPSIYDELLVDLYKSTDGTDFDVVGHPIIALNLVSIEDTGRIIYLNSDLRQYTVETGTDTFNKYHILGENPKVGGLGEIDIDSYRTVLSSGYNVFKSKTSGKLAILAELVTIDSYSVTHSVIPKKINVEGVEQNAEGYYDVVIHTDVEPLVTPSNYKTVPKLSYYYLSNSQGYLQLPNENINLFTEDNQENIQFLGTNLNQTYISTDSKNPLDLDEFVSDSGKFYFPKSGTYHGRMEKYEGPIGSLNESVYTQFFEDKYHRVSKAQISDSTGLKFKQYFKLDLKAKFYKYDPNKTGFTPVEKTEEISEDYTYYVKTTKYEYYDAARNSEEFEGTGIPLFKIETTTEIADDDVINDSSIEKFQESIVNTYTEATQNELDNYDQVTLYSKEGNTYTKLSGAPVDGVTYYTLKVDRPMVSIGFTPDKTQYPGDIFYYPGTKAYVEANEDDLKVYWDFETYPMEDEAPYGSPIMLYYREEIPTYRLATASELSEFTSSDLILYYKQDYTIIDYSLGLHPEDEPIFVVVPIDSYVPISEFTPDINVNYIEGYDKPEGEYDYPKDDPLALCQVAEYVPSIYEPEEEDREVEVTQYPDVKLAGIKIPDVLTINGLDLPFKYTYTLVPCMNYGKLNHLAVSNTVDFNNLHAFAQSNFTEWRYHLDGNQLRLTFGAEIFDTYEDFKVDALVLEFYDSWGFAGSLEIANKKSYSGTFTKLISLNTIGGLSKKRILNNSYNSDFIRNVNIEESENDVYKFKDTQVTYSNEGGWVGIDAVDNDCGVLYSNLIYGVKAYLRRTVDTGFEFIHKKNYFLFTLPIYNDYYYKVSDFSTLINPKLEMQLTYKLVDESTKTPYTGNSIVNGYNENDSKSIDSFKKNEAADTFNVTKYYKYTGTSNLYLELGLKEDYTDMNLKYDPEINSIFEYNLQLLSDDVDSDIFTIKSNKNSLLRPLEVLKYKHSSGELPLSLNKVGFESSYKSKLSDQDLSSKMFINYSGSDPIPINYEFVVGYSLQMSNLVKKEFPTTTVCALYHYTDDMRYNEEDFNIESRNDENNNTSLMSSLIFYNSGDRYKKKWGICKQQALTGNAEEQLYVDVPHEAEATPVTKAGVMNTGADLEVLIPYIGKLAFCNPHAHAVDLVNGVNVHGDSSHPYWAIPPQYGKMLLHAPYIDWLGGKSYDDTEGTVPCDRMYHYPKYNLVLNTYKALTTRTEFVSTMYCDTISGKQALYCNGEEGWLSWQDCSPMRQFVGMTGTELVTFNQKLLKTMSTVYVYNPDYTTITKLSGDVLVDDLSVQVVSNIINTKSNLKFDKGKTLNDYVYLGSVCLKDYLLKLQKYSNDKIKVTSSDNFLPQLQFIPDMTYCGTESSPYVLTSLTYNFLADASVSSDFTAEGGNLTIRESDGTTHSLNGQINAKALYGFDSNNNCLYQLDVSTYTIDSDGTVKPIQDLSKTKNSVVGCTLTNNYYTSTKTSYDVKSTYRNRCIRGTSLTLNDLIYDPTSDEHRLYVKNNVAEYKDYLRNILWYGPLETNDSDGGNGWATYWNNTWNDQLDCNRLYLYTGPCFIPDRL